MVENGQQAASSPPTYTSRVYRDWRAGKQQGFKVALAFLCVAQGSLFFILPSLGTALFLSPDETAVAVTARAFSVQGHMRIADSFLKESPWLHPRSFVTQGEAMAPVGFLGLPILLGILSRSFGEWSLVFVTPLLALSVAYPLWRFTKKWRPLARGITVLAWLSFPTVILYANRGLFPNLPVVTFSIWASFLLWERRTSVRCMLAGLCAGVALAIRPVEALWIIPLLVVAWKFRQSPERHQERKLFAMFVLTTLFPLFLAAFVAWKTYGSPVAVGYWLRDTASHATQSGATPVSALLLPFGIHPRNLWFNLRSYFGGFLWPWALMTVLAAALSLREAKLRPLHLLALWTFFVLLLIYGQTIYQDHVGVNVVSLGNSFLRYLLPLVIFISLGAGFVAERFLSRLHETRGALVLLGIVFLLCVFSTRAALVAGDETIVTSRVELLRYQRIRQATELIFGPRAIILSERSDKIFFPRFRAASPLPDFDKIRELVSRAKIPVALFSETLDAKHLAAWNAEGLLLFPVFQEQRQTMYVIEVAQHSSFSMRAWGF